MYSEIEIDNLIEELDVQYTYIFRGIILEITMYSAKILQIPKAYC